MRKLPFALPFATAALLGGCGPLINAPSLAPRAVEKQPIDLPAAADEPLTPASPALTARLAPLVATATSGDDAFARQRAETEAAIGRSGAATAGSEAWIVAQQALSALDTARAPVRDAAAAIEELRSDPAFAGSGDRAAIDAAARTIEALDDAEAAAVTALSARLGG